MTGRRHDHIFHDADHIKQALNLTHFVRISLVTRASLPQILRSFSRVQRDPVSAVVPKGGFTHPANLHLTLGALSLPTPSHVETALTVLRSTTARQEGQPFTVQVVGIGNSPVSRLPHKFSRTQRLFSRIEDPSASLHRFCLDVRSKLLDEGLLKPDPAQKTASILQVKVIGTTRLAGVSVAPVLHKQQRPSRPRFDATDLHNKYKDSVLMKDVRLREMHLSEIGLKEVLYENVVVAGYRNIATFLLPGIHADGTEPLQAELEASIQVRTP